uniref:Uncharacterized protein n=1 Tax=Macrostomum lignano TaxID=282301 RepID=A0A1I8FQD2_9PLAT
MNTLRISKSSSSSHSVLKRYCGFLDLGVTATRCTAPSCWTRSCTLADPGGPGKRRKRTAERRPLPVGRAAEALHTTVIRAMPWLHKSKKSSKAGSFGDCPAAGKSGKVPQAASPQQQLHQPAASHDELQAALHSVLEALRNLTEKQRQGPPASPPQHQPEAPQRRHRSSQEKKLADEKQQQQQQQQQQPEPPPISGETFRNLQNYFSRISSRGRSSTEAAVAVSIEESGTTFGTDQLDPPSSASRLRRRNFRPTRRQLLPPEADIVSGLTSEDLQASDASGDGDKDETAADDATSAHDGSPTRRCFRAASWSKLTSPQPPTLTALGCSVVTHCGCPSQQAAAILLIRQEPSVCRPPARAPNQQLPQCDEQHRCSTKSLLIRDAVPEALKPPTEPSVAEAAEKSADCGVASLQYSFEHLR